MNVQQVISCAKSNHLAGWIPWLGSGLGVVLGCVTQQISVATLSVFLSLALSQINQQRQLTSQSYRIKYLEHAQAQISSRQAELLAEMNVLNHQFAQWQVTDPRIPGFKFQLRQLQIKVKKLAIEQANVLDICNQFQQHQPSLPRAMKSPHVEYRKELVIFLDLANLNCSAYQRGGLLSVENLIPLLTQGEAAEIRVYADPQGKQSYLDKLRKMGYKVFTGEGDLDGSIARDMLGVSPRKAVLVSGDGDFVACTQAMQDKGTQVTVASYASNTSRKLKEVADHYIDLSTFQNLIQLPSHSLQRFG